MPNFFSRIVPQTLDVHSQFGPHTNLQRELL